MKNGNAGFFDTIKICDLGVAINCNFQCKMCYFWKNRGCSDKVMSISDWKALIGQLQTLFPPDLKVIFSGFGEVLLRRGVEELLCLSASKFKVGLNSNGYLIDEPMARLIARNVESLSLSLDGVKPRTHDYIRGKSGAHAAVVEAVELLRRQSENMFIHINTVIMEYNIDEIIDLVKWVDARNINGIILQAVSMPMFTPLDRYWYKNKFSFLWPKEKNKIEELIDRLIECKQNGSKIVNSIRQLQCFKSYFFDPEKAIEALHCEVDRALKIDPEGNVRICAFSDPIGNVKTVSLPDILNSELAETEREKASHCQTPCHLLVNCFHDQEDA